MNSFTGVVCGVCDAMQRPCKCTIQGQVQFMKEQNMMKELDYKPNPLCACGTPLKEVSKGKWECQRECWNVKPKVKRWLWRSPAGRVLCLSEEETRKDKNSWGFSWQKMPNSEIEMDE